MTKASSTRPPAPILKHFKSTPGWLSPEKVRLQSIMVSNFEELAETIDAEYAPCPEVSTALRKLLEARDCLMRAGPRSEVG